MSSARRFATLVAITFVGGCRDSAPPPVTIYAAASVAEAVQQLPRVDGAPLRVVSAASSALARQIRAGAPADLFLSANAQWTRWLEDHRVPSVRTVDLLSNTLVVVRPAGTPPQGDWRDGRVALGDPSHVPAGRYAQLALQARGEWEGLKPRVVPTAHVRAALALAETAQVDAAIVYATDAKISRRVEVVETLTSSPAITYPLVYLGATTHPRVDAVFSALTSSAAREHFARQGFRPGGALR